MPASWRFPRGGVADTSTAMMSSIAVFCAGVMGMSGGRLFGRAGKGLGT